MFFPSLLTLAALISCLDLTNARALHARDVPAVAPASTGIIRPIKHPRDVLSTTPASTDAILLPIIHHRDVPAVAPVSTGIIRPINHPRDVPDTTPDSTDTILLPIIHHRDVPAVAPASTGIIRPIKHPRDVPATAPASTDPIRPIINRRDIPATAPASTDPIRSIIHPRGELATAPGDTDEIELLPMRVDPLHRYLNRRSELPDLDDYSRLVPSAQELMMYGIPLDDGSVFVANFTLHAPPDSRILLMEKFEGLTRFVDCSTVGDNKLSVSLIDEDVFEYIKIWSWINERDDNQFVMITNHEGCGPRSQRAVFWVKKVDYVEEALRVDFYAVQTEWAEVAGTYSIDYGTMDMESNRVYGPLEKRDPGIFDVFKKVKQGFEDVGKKIKNTAENIGNKIKNTAQKVGNEVKNTAQKVGNEVKKGVQKAGQAVGKVANGKVGKDNISLNLALGKSGAKTNLFTSSRQTIDCVDCFVSGKIIMAGHLQFQNFIPKSALFEARPQGLGTVMKFRVFIKANGPSDGFKFEKDVYSMTLPSLSIPGVFSLGPKAALTVGFSSNVRSDADFTFGVKGSVPNTAIFRKDFLNKNAPGTSDKWSGASVQALPFELLGGAIDMHLDASTNLILGVGISVIQVVNYEAGFKVRLPRIGVDLKTITNKNNSPACPGAANKSPTGVSMTSDVNIELAGIAGDTMHNKFTEKVLWGVKIPLPKKCFPIKDGRGKAQAAVTTSVKGLFSNIKNTISQAAAAKKITPSKSNAKNPKATKTTAAGKSPISVKSAANKSKQKPVAKPAQKRPAVKKRATLRRRLAARKASTRRRSIVRRNTKPL